MLKYLLVVLSLVVCISGLSQSTEGRIGMGLGGIGGFSMEFVDAGKTMRNFDGATLDENGNPQNDFQIVVFDMRPCCPWLGSVDDPKSFVPELMAGKYKMSFNGQANISSIGDPVVIQNKKYNAADNLTTFDLIVQKNNWLVYLTFTSTKRTASSATNTGITNIRLLRPGYHNRANDIFRQEFLNAVSHFPVIRFMDFVQTNNSNPDFPGTTEWSERILPTRALFTGVSPWEYAVALANQTGKDIWINIPVAANDDYVENLAQFLKVNLHGDARIYFEYSNEVWNAGFTQYAYNMAAAKAEVQEETGGGEPTPLNDDVGQCDPADENLWGGRRYVRRMKEIGDIFIEIFSPGDRSSFGTKVRPVFAWQIGGWIPYYSCILTWFENVYGAGSAKENFYGLAGAAYVNAEGTASNATAVQLHSQMITNSDAARGKLRDAPTTWWTGVGKIGLRQIADIFEIRMLQYETGPDNGGGSEINVASRISANRIGGMKEVLLHDLGTNWFDDPQINGDLVMYFVLASSYNRYGSWGATEELENMHSPKLKAIYQLAGIIEDNEGPTFPANVLAAMDGTNAVVSWDAAEDNVGVTHYRILDSGGALATVLANEPLTVTLADYNAGTIQSIKVIAFDAFNNSSGYTNVVTSVNDDRTGNVAIAPNPFHDRLSITFEHPVSDGLVLVTDMLGREMISKRFDELTSQLDMPLKHLQSGLYTIKIASKYGVTAKKVVKQ